MTEGLVIILKLVKVSLTTEQQNKIYFCSRGLKVGSLKTGKLLLVICKSLLLVNAAPSRDSRKPASGHSTNLTCHQLQKMHSTFKTPVFFAHEEITVANNFQLICPPKCHVPKWIPQQSTLSAREIFQT